MAYTPEGEKATVKSMKRHLFKEAGAKSKALKAKKEYGDREMARKGGHKFASVKRDLDIK